MVFARHWHESAMGVHVSPILNPHPIPQGHPSAPALSAQDRRYLSSSTLQSIVSGEEKSSVHVCQFTQDNSNVCLLFCHNYWVFPFTFKCIPVWMINYVNPRYKEREEHSRMMLSFLFEHCVESCFIFWKGRYTRGGTEFRLGYGVLKVTFLHWMQTYKRIQWLMSQERRLESLVRDMWMWYIALSQNMLLHIPFLQWYEVIKCLLDKMKQDKWHKHCVLSLGYYWPSSDMSEGGSSA